MIEIDIPGYKKLQLKNLVLDYNGTLSTARTTGGGASAAGRSSRRSYGLTTIAFADKAAGRH